MFTLLAKTVDLQCFGPNVLTLCSGDMDTAVGQKPTYIMFWIPETTPSMQEICESLVIASYDTPVILNTTYGRTSTTVLVRPFHCDMQQNDAMEPWMMMIHGPNTMVVSCWGPCYTTRCLKRQ